MRHETQQWLVEESTRGGKNNAWKEDTVMTSRGDEDVSKRKRSWQLSTKQRQGSQLETRTLLGFGVKYLSQIFSSPEGYKKS